MHRKDPDGKSKRLLRAAGRRIFGQHAVVSANGTGLCHKVCILQAVKDINAEDAQNAEKEHEPNQEKAGKGTGHQPGQRTKQKESAEQQKTDLQKIGEKYFRNRETECKTDAYNKG